MPIHQVINLESSYFIRIFDLSDSAFRTSAFQALPSHAELILPPGSEEGKLTVNGVAYILGGSPDESFSYDSHCLTPLTDGGTRLEITFAVPGRLPKGLVVKAIYEASGVSPVLIKWLRIENNSPYAVRLDGLTVEEFIPNASGPMALMLEDDYVRGAMTIHGKSCHSPWIENQSIYVNEMLTVRQEITRFAYPEKLDRWIYPGGVFNSFRVFEFVVPNSTKDTKGLAFRKATRSLFPWTTNRCLCCGLAPAAGNIAEYYTGIEKAAEVGYEYVYLCHGWINNTLTSPLFTTYADYELRPDLFPNGWADVRKLTDFAHQKGLKIYFYSIYVSIWDDMKSKAVTNNQWELVWGKGDTSARWGKTLCPGTDWGPFINRMMEDAILNGGFDAWSLDGPYYGDVSVAEGRAYRPGGPNQLLAWERQVEFYEKMKTLGFPGEAAQGFCAFAHGMSRITTSGYDEGDFGNLGMWAQILSTRKGAYIFTYLYRQQQASSFIPVVSWLNGPCLEPMEEHASEYNAYLANCFGYGFQGKCFQHVPYEGPKSKAVILRWLNFWKSHANFFEKGYLLHVKEPDGENLDAVMHVLMEGRQPRALLVVYNPQEQPQEAELKLPLELVNFPGAGWTALSETGEEVEVSQSCLLARVPGRDAAWYELFLK